MSLTCPDLWSHIPTADRSAARFTFSCQLWQASPAQLEELAAELVAGGLAVFVEPTAAVSPVDRLQRIMASTDRSRLGHDFTVDVPARLRAVGLTPTTVVRCATGLGGRLSYVAGSVRMVVSPTSG